MGRSARESVGDEATRQGESVLAEDAVSSRVSSTKAKPEDVDDLRAEVERLRDENAKLRSAAPSHSWRNAWAGVMVAAGVVLLALAISAVWLNRTVMNEDRWVATVAPLAADAAIQQYIADSASDAIDDSVDIQAKVEAALAKLPPETKILATPITGAVKGLVREAATEFVRSPEFPKLWIGMNRLAHRAFIASITQSQGRIINNRNGQVVLDIGVLTEQVKKTLSDKGLTFVNGISIPAAKRRVVLYESAELAQLGLLISAMNMSAYVLPIAALAFLVGGVAIAASRRKAVLWMGIGIVAAAMLPLQAIYLSQIPFANAAYSLGGMPGVAAQHAHAIVFRDLVRAEQAAALLGIAFVLGAMVAGPSGWAVGLRRGLDSGLNNIGAEWDFGPAGEWVLVHAAGMRATGLIGAIVVLLIWPTKSVATVLWLSGFVVVWLLLVTLFGRPRPNHSTAREDAGRGPGAPQAA